MFSYVMTPNVENTTPHNLIPEHIPRTLIFKTTIELPGMAVKRKYFFDKDQYDLVIERYFLLLWPLTEKVVLKQSKLHL